VWPAASEASAPAGISHYATFCLNIVSHYAIFAVKEIAFTSAAARQWRKLAPATRAQIDLKLTAFAETGVGDVKALKGVAGMRLRAGDWRVLFTIKTNTVTIHAVGHRRDIYD
jgi:mRNA interferase RelE/StbE